MTPIEEIQSNTADWLSRPQERVHPDLPEFFSSQKQASILNISGLNSLWSVERFEPGHLF